MSARIASFLAFLLVSRSAFAADDRPRIVFVGLWDRAVAALSAASHNAGVPVHVVITHTGRIGEVHYEDFDLVLVLQVSAGEAHELCGHLAAARGKQPNIKVLQVDERPTHVELLGEGGMERDPKLQAFWRGFSQENLRRLLRYVSVRYLGEAGEEPEPVPFPVSGLYHPDATSFFEDVPSYLSWARSSGHFREGASIVAHLIQPDYVGLGDAAVIDALVRALERRGANVVSLFGDDEGQKRLLGAVRPDLLVLQRHSGPEGGLPPAGQKTFLEQLDVPYLGPVDMLQATIEEWERDPQGMREVFTQVAVREVHGVIEPCIIGGKQDTGKGYALHQPIPERMEHFADRAMGWSALRTKANAEKRVAIIYYQRFPGKADIGRSASISGTSLDTHASLALVLRRMKERGFRVDRVPKDGGEVLKWMRRAGYNCATWAPGDLEELVENGSPVLIPVSVYQRWFEEKLSPANRERVIAAHGPPPGRLMTVERGGERCIVLPVIDLGGVLLAPQPERAETMDESLLHNRDHPPTHQYLAFYFWLQRGWKADALVHFGTHGSEIHLPGKETGPAAADFPDLVIGSLPNINPWVMDNLGEAMIAKRRAYAVLVDHLVPSLTEAGEGASAAQLRADVHKFASLEDGLVREEYRRTITERARAAGLDRDLAIAPGRFLADDEIRAVGVRMCEMATQDVSVGLHVLGEPPRGTELVAWVTGIVARQRPLLDHVRAHLSLGPDADKVLLRREAEKLLAPILLEGHRSDLPKDLADDVAYAKEIASRFSRCSDEVDRVIDALEGRFVPPGPGPTPERNPASIPTGRNLYGVNPDEIPTREAWTVGRFLVDRLIERGRAEHGGAPRKLAFNLNGMETFRDMGTMEAEVLYAIGVRPLWNEAGLVVDVEVIPSAELGRPRLDVFVAVGSIYVKNFPTRVKLLDRALSLARVADGESWLRDGSAALERTLLSKGFAPNQAAALAGARLFGATPGEPGLLLRYLTPRGGAWEKRDELASVYRSNMGSVYVGEMWGAPVEGLFESALSGTEAVVSHWGACLTTPLSNRHTVEGAGGLSLAVECFTGRRPGLLFADLRNPEDARLRDVEEVLRTEYRTTLFNERWIAGLKKYGYLGAAQITDYAKNTFGWQAMREGSVDPSVWNELYSVYVKDSCGLGLRQWFEETNPHALQEVLATSIEAVRKGFWRPEAGIVADLVAEYARSVERFGYSAGVIAGGNAKFQRFVAGRLAAAGMQALARRFDQAVGGSETPPARVEGKRLECVQPPREPPPWLTLPLGIGVVSLLLVAYGFVRRTTWKR